MGNKDNFEKAQKPLKISPCASNSRRRYLFLFSRYFVLLLLGLYNLKLFYFLFTPLTVRPVFWIISLFYDNASFLVGNTIFFGEVYVRIIFSCVAGAAYYLLLILNLSTPMDFGKRIRSILFLLLTFLVLNIIRILVFAFLSVSNSQYFNLAHTLMWYFGSTAMVAGIWFLNIWVFRIKGIPIYSDVKEILESIKRK